MWGGGGGGGRPNDFKCVTVTGRFPSDGAVSMPLKGLNKRSKQFYFTCFPTLASNRTDKRRLITVCRRMHVFSLHFNGTRIRGKGRGTGSGARKKRTR